MGIKNRITTLFERKSEEVLSIFTTVGFPAPGDTVPICEELVAAGVDLIELGFPYSDSLVDGPTIQHSNEVALGSGMTLEKYFEQATEIRSRVDVPLIFMSCMNPLLQYGVERFCDACVEAGIDGVILPDLPVGEYVERYQVLFEDRDLSVIFLVTARTPEERVRQYDALASGFLYAVSSDSTTGNQLEMDLERKAYFERLREYGLTNPVLVGFGISNAESFRSACQVSSGGIIGSAFIRVLEQPGEIRKNVRQFIETLRGED